MTFFVQMVLHIFFCLDLQNFLLFAREILNLEFIYLKQF